MQYQLKNAKCLCKGKVMIIFDKDARGRDTTISYGICDTCMKIFVLPPFPAIDFVKNQCVLVM
jgi:hypothetical protein